MFLFEHACVRDLAWAIRSCPLIKSLPNLPCVSELDCWSWYEHFLPQLQALDVNPELLMHRLAELSSTRLGDYFATLIEYWLIHRLDIEQLQSRIIITQQQQTIGELDFVYFSKNKQKTVHWEVAVKFYLRYQDLEGKVSFIGPNPEDEFNTKLSHLQHQLKMGEHPAAQKWLKPYYQADLIHTCFIKGYLFYPWGEPIVDLFFPSEAHEQHLKGWWLSYHSLVWKQWCQYALDEASHWLILSKLSWLSPACILKDSHSKVLNAIQCIQQIKEHFELHTNCLLIAQLQKDSFGNWIEFKRGFIVDSRWPGTFKAKSV